MPKSYKNTNLYEKLNIRIKGILMQLFQENVDQTKVIIVLHLYLLHFQAKKQNKLIKKFQKNAESSKPTKTNEYEKFCIRPNFKSVNLQEPTSHTNI